MILTKEEQARAAERGWTLCEVFDLERQKLMVEALPLDLSKATRENVQQHLVRHAKAGDALSIKALTVIAQSTLYKRQ